MAGERKQEWNAGDYFAMQLVDKTLSIGQVIARDPLALKNAPICAFFRNRVESAMQVVVQELTEADIVAVLFVTRDLLDSGQWRVFAHGTPINPKAYFRDIDERRARGFVGTKTIGSGNIVTLLNAYHGLCAWDSFLEPDYLDKLLVSPDRKPAKVMLKEKLKGPGS